MSAIFGIAIKWLAANWRQVAAFAVIGALIIGGSVFYSSWKTRGVKNERLEIQLETEQLARASDRAKCAEIADILTSVNARNAELVLKSNQQRAAFIEADTISAKQIEYNRSEAESATVEAVEAISRAATCEEKVAELARVMSEFRP